MIEDLKNVNFYASIAKVNIFLLIFVNAMKGK